MNERLCLICGKPIESVGSEFLGVIWWPTVHAVCADLELGNLHLGPRAMGQGGKTEPQKQIRDWDKC